MYIWVINPATSTGAETVMGHSKKAIFTLSIATIFAGIPAAQAHCLALFGPPNSAGMQSRLTSAELPLQIDEGAGAEGTVYWRDGNLSHVTATHYGETGKRTDQVSLFDDGSKIMVSTTEHYDRPTSVDGQNVVGTISRRLVICPAKPLNFPNGDEYEDLLQSATDLIAKARDAVRLHKPAQSR